MNKIVLFEGSLYHRLPRNWGTAAVVAMLSLSPITTSALLPKSKKLQLYDSFTLQHKPQT